jgi:hypothetical protein
MAKGTPWVKASYGAHRLPGSKSRVIEAQHPTTVENPERPSIPRSTGSSRVVDLEQLLATRLLVQGNSGSGKSHLLRRLLEQSAPWVQQTIIDPDGASSPSKVAGEWTRIHRVSTVLNPGVRDTGYR